jgi:hypothetical protein
MVYCRKYNCCFSFGTKNKCPELVWLQTAIVPKLRSSLAQKTTAERKIVKKIAFFVKDLTPKTNALDSNYSERESFGPNIIAVEYFCRIFDCLNYRNTTTKG